MYKYSSAKSVTRHVPNTEKGFFSNGLWRRRRRGKWGKAKIFSWSSFDHSKLERYNDTTAFA